MIGLGGLSLVDALGDLRVELHRHGKELVLLFEDIAITRGLQLDLVDALTTPAVRDGEQRLCTMRVALAVTSSYWDEKIPETLLTRAHAWKSEMFDLDAPDGADRAPELIGRYLNAARIGIDTLQSGSGGSREVVNACDTCPRRVPCHDAFGVTTAGHGLFPLTHSAARTLSALADQDARPRLVLSNVVAPVLDDREALALGVFPTGGPLETLVDAGVKSEDLVPLPIEQTTAVAESHLSEADKGRARTLMRAWGPEHLAQVLELFGLPPELAVPAAGGIPARPEKPAPGANKSATSRQQAQTREHDPDRAEVEAWADGRELKRTPSLTLRNLVWNELREGIRWNEIAANRAAALELLGITTTRNKGAKLANLTVKIEHASGGGSLGAATEPLVTLDASPINARLFSALLTQNREGSLSSAGGAHALAQIRAFVASVESALATRVRARLATPAHLADVGKLLALASGPLVRELGIEGVPTFDTALKAIPKDVESPEGISKDWAALRTAAISAHEQARSLVVYGATKSQGETGEPTVIDPTLIDMKAITRDPYGLQRGLATEPLKDRCDQIVALATVGVEAERETVGLLVAAIESHIGAGNTLALKTIKDALDSAFEVANSAHLLAPAGVRRS